jgi:hypothetical protein
MILRIIFGALIIIFVSKTVSLAFLCKKEKQRGFIPLLLLAFFELFVPALAYTINHLL